MASGASRLAITICVLAALCAPAGARALLLPLPARGAARDAPPAVLRGGEGGETKKKSGKKSRKKKPAVRFSGKFALRVVYDDNFIHYSGADLEAFETEPNLGRYSITSAGDWIIRPRLDLTGKTGGFYGESAEARLRLSTWRYAWNSIKNNESIQLRLKHGAWGVSNFQLTFYHAPEKYIRNFRDRAPYAPRSTTPLEYTDFSYTSNSLALAFWKRYTKRIDGKLELKHSWRYFNQPFMENDNWEWRLGGYVAWKALGFLKMTGEYLYSTVEARGADSVGESRENSDNSDPSYDRDSYRLTLTFYPKRARLPVNQIAMKGQYQAYYFTSIKTLDEDPFHVGRRDEIYRFETTWSTRPLFGPASLEGGYRYTERTSTAPEASHGEDIGEEKDYTDNRFWVGVEYPF